MNTVGQAITKLRNARGMSQLELAERANVSSGHLSLIERDLRHPLWSTIKKLAHALDVNITVVAMMTEADDPAIAPYMPLIYKTVWERELV